MENLLSPDLGLMFWTVVTFLLMVAILKKVAWGPLLKTLDDRESALKAEREAAQQNRLQMEELKNSYEKNLAEVESRAKEILQEAERKGKSLREEILKTAQEEAEKFSTRTRNELAAERERLIGDLRAYTGELTIKVLEKLLAGSIDATAQKKRIDSLLSEIESGRQPNSPR